MKTIEINGRKSDGSWVGTQKTMEGKPEFTLYPTLKVALRRDCLPLRQMELVKLNFCTLEELDAKESATVPKGYSVIEDPFTLNEVMENL